VTRLVLLGVIVSIALIAVVTVLIRTRRLQERYALLWLVAAAGVVVFGLWINALEVVADVVGIAYAPSALFLLVAAFLVLVILDLAIVVSRLVTRLHTLAQRHSLLEERVHQLESQGAPELSELPELTDEPVGNYPSGGRRKD
jgi:hypothetical protein